LRWEMSAATVNAYYHPFKNIIVFPAAILQAPFYSLKQTSSENYGGIGAVIAHEISHAFDNNGALFDEYGNLNNWWTEADLAHFKQLAQKMIAEFD
ncbi:M13 family peptidase, partial [Roseburia hominis]|nr:M13 family peptidase [Roseburia hominis]